MVNRLYGPAAVTQILANHALVFRVADFLGLFAYTAALVGIVIAIPWNYRRLQDADQRRRVNWFALGSAIAIVGQLWCAAVTRRDSACRQLLAEIDQPEVESRSREQHADRRQTPDTPTESQQHVHVFDLPPLENPLRADQVGAHCGQ